MKQENDVREKLSKETEKLRMEREVHVKMLELLADIAHESRRVIFTLPVKASRVTDKINNVMMLATKMDDDVEYATKACEFLDRVEEACVAFMEQEQAAGE